MMLFPPGLQKKGLTRAAVRNDRPFVPPRAARGFLVVPTSARWPHASARAAADASAVVCVVPPFFVPCEAGADRPLAVWTEPGRRWARRADVVRCVGADDAALATLALAVDGDPRRLERRNPPSAAWLVLPEPLVPCAACAAAPSSPALGVAGERRGFACRVVRRHDAPP
mmetsp:Transcript_17600/g.70685  ORF Transcript_17600/g.70685 Transcript_17600/m.70685 type:complete len:170 (+) Transcript_17600:582-1091(+)